MCGKPKEVKSFRNLINFSIPLASRNIFPFFGPRRRTTAVCSELAGEVQILLRPSPTLRYIPLINASMGQDSHSEGKMQTLKSKEFDVVAFFFFTQLALCCELHYQFVLISLCAAGPVLVFSDKNRFHLALQ